MAEDKAQPFSGPDFRAGTKFSELTDREPLLGYFDGEPAVLVRQGDKVFATGAVCSHYGGPLAKGSWCVRQYGIRGIMPASTFARAKRSRRRLSIGCFASPSGDRAM